jgi:hypothetical protein
MKPFPRIHREPPPIAPATLTDWLALALISLAIGALFAL